MSKKARYILTTVTLIFAALVIYASRTQIIQAYELLDDLNLITLIIGVVFIQILSYGSNAYFYRTFFESFRLYPGLLKLFKMSLALNYVNNVIPSVGVSGASWMGYVLKRVPTGKTTLSQVVRYVLTYITFIALLAVGTLGLYFSGDITQITVRISVLLALTIILGSIFIAYIIAKRERIDQAAQIIVKGLEKIVGLFRSEKKEIIPEEKLKDLLDEFHNGYELIRKEKSLLRGPLLHAFLGNLFEVLTVYAVFVAFGEWVNFGAVVLAYALANLSGLIAIIPGSIGLYEGVMVATMTAAGIPASLSLSVTLVYRITSMIIFLPVGFYFYNELMKERGQMHDDHSKV